MPLWSRVAAGLALAIALLGFAGFKAYSEKLGPIIQAYGTTYYHGEGPPSVPIPCKSENEILAAIVDVHAKYDYLEGAELEAFEQRAAYLRGLPPLGADKLYIVTEDDQLRDGNTVLFIGLRSNCVSTVFSFPTRLYRELTVSPRA
ncbi:MAG: hypothetical protein ACRECX_07675 [Methyloceanibacter sp.]|uniref:hypothetical protein n=1 Tax=Methyloceanibacter sp. TaxID=1965321 RepID=UPI003D6D42FE